MTTIIARGKVGVSQVNGRTLIQIDGLDEDTHDLVELVLPPGYVANPLTGSDVLELQITGTASHKVAIAGDHTQDAVANLAPGECGLSRGGQTILLRLTGAHVVSPFFAWGLTEAALKRMIHEEFQFFYNAHEHNLPGGGVTSAPTVPMPDSCLTGGT